MAYTAKYYIASGAASLDFGAITQTEYNTSVDVVDSLITATSKIVATLSGEITADHEIDEIFLSRITLVCGNISAGVGFTIYGSCLDGTHGIYKINYTITY